ncbi:phospholipid phosphatase 2 isoform X3 [Melopsittacus undulatus]|uniref:phospholipid phosphatase 2 isoform X3 n=1 Tax=Melopsittacus undulatus TaxID=13146 RepID=UPI00146C5FD5|nr:phospholipid phosphatase 2 isoform X3 [Melopsittacus undulatus]
MERRKVFVVLDVLCLAVASLPFVILTLVNSPYKRGFYCNDDSIRYPYKADTITHGLMAGVTITCTVVILSSGELYLVYTERLYSKSEFNNYLAALYKVVGTFLFGGAISQSLTDLAKYMIGRLRPNFLAVCNPDWSKVNCSIYVQLENICQGESRNVTESSSMCKPGWWGSGPGCCVPPSSSSSSPSLSTWATPGYPTTSTTGAMCWWGCSKGLSSPSSSSDTSPTSSSSVPLGRAMGRTRSTNPASHSP